MLHESYRLACVCVRFPHKHPELLAKWILAVKRNNWKPSQHSVLCSQHFARTAYKRPPGFGSRPLLKDDAVPTIFPAHPAHLQPVSKLA